MSVITFQCFACNQVLQVGADKAGRKAKCSQCGTVLTIPVLAGAASEGVLPAASLPAASLPAAPVARPVAAPPAALPSALPPSAPPPVPAPARIDDVKVIDDEPRRRRLYDDDDDEPRSRRRRDDDYDVRRPVYSKWDKVRIGFLIAFIGLCVVAG